MQHTTGDGRTRSDEAHQKISPIITSHTPIERWCDCFKFCLKIRLVQEKLQWK